MICTQYNSRPCIHRCPYLFSSFVYPAIRTILTLTYHRWWLKCQHRYNRLLWGYLRNCIVNTENTPITVQANVPILNEYVRNVPYHFVFWSPLAVAIWWGFTRFTLQILFFIGDTGHTEDVDHAQHCCCFSSLILFRVLLAVCQDITCCDIFLWCRSLMISFNYTECHYSWSYFYIFNVIILCLFIIHVISYFLWQIKQCCLHIMQ